jgi:signal transduction histidine kinase
MTRYHVFLSYISKDADTMWRVFHDLRAEGLTVWIDQTNLEPGTLAWDRAIEEAIVNSDCLVVILSPGARKSEWVREELHYAKQLGKRIFPLLASGEAQDAIPFGFSTAQWTDIRDDHRYQDGIHKLIDTLCKNIGIESRTARLERIERERKQNAEREKKRRALEELRLQVQALAHQRQLLQDKIENTAQEEHDLRLQLDFVAMRRQKLQDDYRVLCQKEQQSQQLLLQLSEQLRAMQRESDEWTQPLDSQWGDVHDQPPRDWSSELPHFAAFSYTDEETEAVWDEIPEMPDELPEMRQLKPGYPELPAPRFAHESEREKARRKRRS